MLHLAPIHSILRLMRKFAAHLALAALWAGLGTPFLTAAEGPSLPACCLRTGSHHCQTPSSEDLAWRSERIPCPYSTARPLAKLTALGVGSRRLSSLTVLGFILAARPSSGPTLSSRQTLSRGPRHALSRQNASLKFLRVVLPAVVRCGPEFRPIRGTTSGGKPITRRIARGNRCDNSSASSESYWWLLEA